MDISEHVKHDQSNEKDILKTTHHLSIRYLRAMLGCYLSMNDDISASEVRRIISNVTAIYDKSISGD